MRPRAACGCGPSSVRKELLCEVSAREAQPGFELWLLRVCGLCFGSLSGAASTSADAARFVRSPHAFVVRLCQGSKSALFCFFLFFFFLLLRPFCAHFALFESSVRVLHAAAGTAEPFTWSGALERCRKACRHHLAGSGQANGQQA